MIRQDRDEIMEKENAHVKMNIRMLVVLFGAALLTEIFVFNFRSLQSIFYREHSWEEYDVELQGVRQYDDGLLSIQDEEAAIRISGIDMEIKNVCLDLEPVDSIPLNYKETGVCKAEIYGTDKGNEVNNLIAQCTVSQENTSSKYHWIQPSGQEGELIIVISMPTGHLFKIHEICLNAKKPFSVSLIRLLIVWLILLLCYGLRRNSSWWREGCVTLSRPQKLIVAALFFFFFGISWYIMNSNTLIYGAINPDEPMHTYNPYQELAWALDEGRVSLLEEPSAELLAMDNPYDYGARIENDVYAKFDFVLYEGKYYVYHGILPCMVFYYPLYHFFGLNMPNSLPVFVCCLLFGIGFYVMMRRIMERYFKKTPFALLVLFTLTELFGCQLPFFITQPTSYVLTIIAAAALTVWGLGFWIAAKREGQNAYSPGKLLAGSFCMAGVAACRPTFLLYSILSFALFGRDWLAKSGGCNKKERIRDMAAFAVPYIIVAIPLMIYNAVRFGSPFEFGAKYNLTAYDLVNLRFSFDRIHYAVWEYVFRSPDWNYFFPYLKAYPAYWNHEGHTPVIFDAGIRGGLLSMNLFLAASVVVFAKKKEFQKKGLLTFCMLLAGISAVMMIFDVEFTGCIIYRYLADFSFALFTVAWCGILWLQEVSAGKEAHDAFRKILIAAVLLSVAMNATLWFVEDYKYPLSKADTQLYYRIFYGFNFW